MTESDFQLISDLGQAADVASLERQLVSAANRIGFDVATAIVVNPSCDGDAKFTTIGNIPSEFLTTSQSTVLSKRDPVLRKLKFSAAPFFYDRHFYRENNASDLWETMAEHGYQTGLAIALHLANERHFILGFDRKKTLERNSLASLLTSFTFIAVHAQEAALRLLDRDAAREPDVVLSAQEVECLKWRGEGKSAWETGALLNLSASRVNKICTAATVKLNCTTTTQAAFKALRCGLLK